jgi:ABC-type spermidine/putrescine transport system permease subunit II
MGSVNLALGSWAGVVFLFLYLPIAILVLYSFNRSRLNIIWEGFTLHWYGDVGLGWYGELLKYLLASAVHLVSRGATQP